MRTIQRIGIASFLLLAACSSSKDDGSSDGRGSRDAMMGIGDLDSTVIQRDDAGNPVIGDASMSNDDASANSMDASVDGAHVPPDGGVGSTACTDGIDNDDDGLIDELDPECTGSADDDESSFGTGIPGDNRDPVWQDCFFDGNSGGGDDRCRYRTECLTGELPSTDEDCVVSEDCIAFCTRGTPNGCDCFGCCDVRTSTGSTVHVLLSSECSVDDLDDTEACVRCVPNDDCANPCGRCELCPGKTLADLPSDCFASTPDGGVAASDAGTRDGGASTSSDAGAGRDAGTGVGIPPPYTCDNGEAWCDASHPCASGYDCVFGCCLEILY